MSGSSGPASAGTPFLAPPSGARRIYVLKAIARIVGSTGLLLGLYYWAPLGHKDESFPVALLSVMLIGLAVVIAVQVRSILESSFPALRAVEALAATIPLLLLSFATCYVAMATTAPTTFNEPLSRTDALYFSVTVFSTVGFGDIVAATGAGRAVVTVQMLVDLLVLGVGLRVITSAVQVGRERRASAPGPPAPGPVAPGSAASPQAGAPQTAPGVEGGERAGGADQT